MDFHSFLIIVSQRQSERGGRVRAFHVSYPDLAPTFRKFSYAALSLYSGLVTLLVPLLLNRLLPRTTYILTNPPFRFPQEAGINKKRTRKMRG